MMSHVKRKRKNDGGEENESLSKFSSPPNTIANRKKVKATLRGNNMTTTATSSPYLSSPPTRNRTESTDTIQSPFASTGDTSTLSPHVFVRDRKSKRQKTLLADRYNWNRELALWAQNMETSLLKKMENSQWTANKKDNHALDTSRHIRKSARKYIDAMQDITQFLQAPPSTEVLVFGSGDCGQLALTEDILAAKRPTMIRSLHDQGVKSIGCGGLHNCTVLQDGSVETWGCNDEGSLGKIFIDTGYLPLKVDGFVPGRVEVAKGLDKVKTWSDLMQEYGEQFSTFSDPTVDYSKVPQERMVKAATGDVQTLVLSDTGRVYMFGSYKDMEGKCFKDEAPEDDPRVHPKAEKRSPAPLDIQSWPIHCWQMPGKAVDIECGCSFNAAIVEKNSTRECVTWGIGQKGELSRPVYSPIKEPEKLERGENDPWHVEYHVDKIKNEYLIPQSVVWAESPPMNRSVESITCGGYHLMVIAKDGVDGSSRVYGSGLNNYGQLGLGHIKDVSNLTKISFFDDCNIAQLGGGMHHSLALDSSGKKLYSFGRNDSGQLGTKKGMQEAGAFESKPQIVSLNSSEDDNGTINEENPVIKVISCGGNHNLASTEKGDVYTWGYGDMGALGHGGERDEGTPRKLDVMKGVNNKKKEALMHKLTANVYLLAGGGQHSAIAAIVRSAAQDQRD